LFEAGVIGILMSYNFLSQVDGPDEIAALQMESVLEKERDRAGGSSHQPGYRKAPSYGWHLKR